MCVAGVLCGALLTTAEAAKPPQVTEDGLELTKSKGVDLLYRRPGATLTGYTKVMIDPVQVAFSKNWNPRDYGRWGLKSDDVQKIRTDLGALANETFAKVLAEGGYPTATAADPGVLRVTAYIVDLFVNAPGAMDMQSSSPSRSYVVNAGQMTLVMELRDAVTGTLLARAFDVRAGSENGRFQYSNSVMNRAEAETILMSWANLLKRGLDSAKSP
jgi:hypothetical protein